MATYKWSVPSGQSITGNTYIKDTDDKLAETMDDLVDFVNGEGVHENQGITYDMVDKVSTQVITGAKTFSNNIVANSGVTGNVTGNLIGNTTGNVTGNATTATSLSAGSDRTKLDGIETGATADQSASEIKALYESQSNTNAYTDAEKTKLSGIATGAEVNVKSDWNATSGDSQILNKPLIMHVREGYFRGTYEPTLNGTFGISNYNDYNWSISVTSTMSGFEHDYNVANGHSPYGGFDYNNSWDSDDSEYRYAYIEGSTIKLKAVHRNSGSTFDIIGRYHLIGVLKSLSTYAQINE